MLHVAFRNKGQCATRSTEYFAPKVLILCNLCRLNILYDSVKLKYDGTGIYDSQKMISDISLTLSKLKIGYIVR